MGLCGVVAVLDTAVRCAWLDLVVKPLAGGSACWRAVGGDFFVGNSPNCQDFGYRSWRVGPRNPTGGTPAEFWCEGATGWAGRPPYGFSSKKPLGKKAIAGLGNSGSESHVQVQVQVQVQIHSSKCLGLLS